jgi:G3E family GTPase
VFADAELLSSVMEGRSSFLEDSVRYIYKKQLEEADVLILNKADLLSEKQLDTLKETIASEYPDKIVLLQNSLAEEDISTWLQTIEQFTGLHKRNSLSIDYNIYGAGEAHLAWLDKSIVITASHDNAIFIAHKIVGAVFDAIQKKSLPIGHLKFFLEAGDWNEKISFTTTSTSSNIPKQEQHAAAVKLLINARVQTEPLVLQTLVDDIVRKAENLYGCRISPEKWTVFKPGYPRPTHRMA